MDNSPLNYSFYNIDDILNNVIQEYTVPMTVLNDIASYRLLMRDYLIIDESSEDPGLDLTFEVAHQEEKTPGPLAQKRIAELVIADAMKKGANCSIKMEPITEKSVCVFPCYHCFHEESIKEWLKTSTTCPECRQPCAL
jgi:hypothetical protein